MEYKKTDLLTFKQFESLVETEFPNEKARLIGNISKNYCCIKHTDLYVLQPIIKYDVVTNGSDYLITMVSSFIELSFKNLDETGSKLIKSEHAKNYKSVFSNADIKKYYEQLKVLLNNDNKVFDMTLNEIHYTNGYYDMKKGEFCKRVPDKHFITKIY